MSGKIRHDFDKLNRLPPYVLAEVIEMMKSARRAGEDIIDLGMGNPDMATPAARDREDLRGGAQPAQPPLLGVARHPEPARRDLRVVPAAPRRRARSRDSEAIAVIGAKEGLSHFVLMTIGPGDVVLCPDPAYPIHQYSVIIAGGDLRHVPLNADGDFIANLEQAIQPHLAQAEDADRLVPGQSRPPRWSTAPSSSGSSPSRARTT